MSTRRCFLSVLAPVAALVAALLLVGCAMQSVRVHQMTKELYTESTNAEILTAATVVLQNHGFTIIMVNEKIGVLTTDWRQVQTSPEDMLFGWPHRDKITLSIGGSPKRVILKPHCQHGTESVTGTIWKDIAIVSKNRAREYEQISSEIGNILGLSGIR